MAFRKPSLVVKLSLPPRPASNKPLPASASGESAPTQSSTSPDILTQFTQSHLVLALTLQKSKPKDLTIKEYFEQLQAHVKIGPNIPPEPQRYVDTAEFWKEQCGKIRQENLALQDKLRCAEESHRLLRQALQRSEANPGSGVSIESSRTHSPGPSNLRKRPSPTLEEDLLDEALPILVPPRTDADLLRLSSYILQLKRQRSKLEEACQYSNTIDQINILTRETTCMLTLLQTPFFECCLPFFSLNMNTAQKHTMNMVQRVITHVGVSFIAGFKAFNELCRTIPGRAKKEELVFHLVMFFDKSLDFLKTFSDLQADEQTLVSRGGRSHKRIRVEKGEFAVNKYLSKMLSSVAYGLEWKLQQPGHSDLLEGILFSVLEHTGRLLSESVFEEHVAASDSPGNISQGRRQKFSDASRVEARYIVQILHATLGGDERKGLVAQILSSGRIPAGQSRHNSVKGAVLSGDVLLKAKKLLQSTLMRTTVGGEDLETLRLPTPPLETTGVVVPKRAVTERYGADWLVETIWALIGWDLMN